MKQNMHILIAGSYGMGNTGDEAILAAILDQLRTKIPQAIFRVVAGDPQYIHDRFSVEAVPWDNWSAILTAVKQSDLVIQGGGGLFFDYGGFNSHAVLQNAASDLAHYGGYSILAGLLNKPFMLYACGVGPLFTEESREMVRLAFSLAHRATVRDAESKALLEEIGVDGTRVAVTADPAFSLQIAGPQCVDAILTQNRINPEQPFICVAPRPWEIGISQSIWETQLVQGLTHFASEKHYQILLIPFHMGYDDATIQRLQDQLPATAVRVLGKGYSVSEIAGLIGKCDLLVGMRLHSLVFAILTGTPAVALVYDPKVRNLARRVGHEEICLDLSDLSRLESLMTSVLARRVELERDFRKAYSKLKTLALQNVDIACSLLNNGGSDLSFSNPSLIQMVAQVVEGRLQEIQDNQEAHRTILQTLNEQLTDRERIIQDLEAEMESLQNSRSWRIANLLRRIRRASGL